MQASLVRFHDTRQAENSQIALRPVIHKTTYHPAAAIRTGAGVESNKSTRINMISGSGSAVELELASELSASMLCVCAYVHDRA